jgi:3-oxoacyl-[acyl-carrier-protein] synthase II
MQKSKRAVITGVGVVSPLGLGWENWVEGLRAGRSATRAISLFDAGNPIIGRDDQAPLSCRVAGECPDFTPHDWMDKRDLERVPRVVPMALAATHEALQSAGLSGILNGSTPDTNAPPTAVVIGSGGGGFSFAEAQFAHWYGGENSQLSPYAVSSAIAGMVSSEISIAFGLRSRSHTFSDGCTSSSDALGNALDLIRSGRETRIICGGADAPITPATIAAFCLMRAISTHWNDEPAKASRPFSKNRDGFVLGEGAWIFVIEEQATALARGAKPLAEIAGYGATCEAFHRVALGAPDEAARAMKMALDDAQVLSQEIDYANLHGTGTQLNDPLETAAIKIALGARAGSTPMSATKSQIGHPQGASGAAGVAATLAAMQNDFLPPTINLQTPDETCDLDYVANVSRAGEVETALCNCLGFGSKNAALVLKKWKHE